jgi:ankyrin repeat protein
MTFNWGESEKAYFNTATKEERNNALANAFLARDWGVFDWIVSQGVHPNEVSYDMLWDAVRKQDEDAVKRLLVLKYDVHRVDDVAFRDAVRLGYMSIAKLLHAAGADPHAVNDDAMSLAAQRGDVAMIRQLRSWGVMVSGWKNDPLIRAAEHGHLDAVKELIKQGAKVEDEEGFYLPLRAALRRNDDAMGRCLLKNLSPKAIEDMLERFEDASAYLPEDWEPTIERWRLTINVAS